MKIYDAFAFLVDEYNLNYAFQTFDLGGGWIISAHSFFNNSGCFTIHNLGARGELDFYYARCFSNEREKLYEKIIDIYSIEKEIWNKNGKLWLFPNLFFWWNAEKVLKVAADVVKAQIQKNNEFCGIKINVASSLS